MQHKHVGAKKRIGNQARIQGGAGSGVHPWHGGTRAEGAGSFVSKAERRDTGVP